MMKKYTQESRSIMKKRSYTLLSIILLLIVACTAVACSNNTEDEDAIDYSMIESIKVDESITSKDFEGFALSDFSMDKITLVVKYKTTYDEYNNEIPGEIKTMQASYSMVKAEDKAKLTTAGTKNITLIYGKFEITFNLKLYDDSITQYKVYFYDRSEVLLGDVQYVPAGGRATQPPIPNVAGYTFVGWIDMDTGRNTTFDNVSKDLRLKAEYVANTYKVEYYYKHNKTETLITSKTIDKDENGADYYPEVPEIEGYEFYEWIEESKSKYVATYKIKKYLINFVYREYKDGKYSDTLKTTSIKYDADTTKVTEIAGARCEGISEGNDYHFIGWYVIRENKKVGITFPYEFDEIYEMTFYAEYIDLHKGTEGLNYKILDDYCEITSYSGESNVIVIPESATIGGKKIPVKKVNESAFKGIKVLEYVVSNNNENFSVDNGVLYNNDYSVLYYYPIANANSSYQIKEETIEINAYAFYRAANLASVTLNSELKLIKHHAFSDCVQLSSVEISRNVVEIEEGAFKMTEKNALNSISFAGTEIKTLGDEVFYGLNTLVSITLPASLSNMGAGVFYGCNSLNEINTEFNSYFNVYNGAIYDVGYKTLYVYPAMSISNANPEIEIHENCTTVLRGAFYHANIVCITINSDIELETQSIVCPALNSIRINVDKLSLTDDEFIQAFGECVPAKVYVKESNSTFALGEAYSYVEVSSYNEWKGYADYHNSYAYEVRDNEVIILGYKGYAPYLDIPEMINGMQVVEIADNAFNSNRYLITVDIPITVKKIGNKAFYNCDSLEEVVFSSGTEYSLTDVGDYAFYDCEVLDSIVYTEGHVLKNFGKYVFDGTPIMERNEEFIVVCGVLLTYTEYATEIVIPKEIVYIATDAFKDMGNIISISFEDGSVVETIDSYAFINCRGLSSISLPISVKRVNDYAFYGCEYLYYVKYDATSTAVEIGKDAYYQAGTHYEGVVYEQFQNSTIYNLNYMINSENYPEQGIAFVNMRKPELSTDEMFIGWYYEEDFINIAKFPMHITEDTTLYARIVPSDYSSDDIEYELTDTDEYRVIAYKGDDKFFVVPRLYKGASVVGVGSNAIVGTVVFISLPHYTDSYGDYQSYIIEVGIDAFVNTEWYKNTAGDFVIYDNILIGYKGDAKVVVVPDRVSVIAEGAFAGNLGIEYVKLPEGVIRVTKNAFNGCTNLKEVVLSTRTIELQEKAFYNCVNLTKINFNQTLALSSISVDALDNTAWIGQQTGDCLIINGILFKYRGTETTLHIPKSVKSIAEYAFADNAKITTVYLPSTLEMIREYAFNNAISLTSVILFKGNNALSYIMDSAFNNCIQLKEFNLKYANNLVEINDRAFANTKSYKDLILPASLTTIGKEAFANSGVLTINVEDGSRLQKFGDDSFSRCSSLYSVVFKGSSMLEEVGAYAFYECVSLKTFVNINANLKVINEYGFYNCRSLTDVRIKETALVTIGEQAVYGLGKVSGINQDMIIFGNILVSYLGAERNVIIPANVTLIYDNAFNGNTDLRNITFEADNVLTSINDRAFYNCINLINITFPKSLSNIGYEVFVGTAWYQQQLVTEDYIIVNTTLIKYNVDTPQQAQIPDVVTTINKGAFDGMEVYDILIGENVTKIKDGAFDGIVPVTWLESGKENTGWTLTLDAIIPPTLEYEVTFENCLGIYLLDADTLATYRLNDKWAIQDEGTDMKVIDRYQVTYSIVEGEGEKISAEDIHALYSEKAVVPLTSSDKNYVFVGWFERLNGGLYESPLTYPYILSKDTTIYAKCVDYDEGSNPQDYLLEDSQDKDGMYSIVKYNDLTDKKVVIITQQANKEIYSVTGYLGYVEYYGTDYTKYVFNETDGVFQEYNEYEPYPDGTKTYRKNDVIEEISFANNCTIEVLGDNSFAGMVNLSKITLPASVKYISANAFAECENLTEIIFSDGMKDVEIEAGAFRNCTQLQKITIPESIKILGDGAFNGCINLKEIYLEATTPIELYGVLPFEFIADMKIYIPAKTYNKYSATWEAYEEYLVELEEVVEQ